MRLLNFAVKILLVSRNLGANNTRDQSRKISSTMHDKETDQRTAAQLSDCQRRVLSRSFKKVSKGLHGWGSRSDGGKRDTVCSVERRHVRARASLVLGSL